MKANGRSIQALLRREYPPAYLAQAEAKGLDDWIRDRSKKWWWPF